jgi:predicted lipoprotein with Yx(FWY)xxD motif
MTFGSGTTRYGAGRVAALVGVALFVAACGSSSSSSSSSAPKASAPTSSSASSAPAAGVAVSTAKGSLGTYLTGPSGRALYIWLADSNGKSSCSGACASAWPPLTTTATPTASGGVSAAHLGTITRSDGAKQVTYMGHPLYYYVGDPGPGTTNGQGSDQFGAHWWLIAPSGGSVTHATAASSSGSTSSSSGGSSSGGSSGGSSSGWA